MQHQTPEQPSWQQGQPDQAVDQQDGEGGSLGEAAAEALLAVLTFWAH